MRLKFCLAYCFVGSAVLSSILLEELDLETEFHRSDLQRAIEKVTRIWSTHDVTIVSRNNRTDDKVDRVIATISKILLPLRPTIYLQTTNLSKFIVNGHMVATSRTLLIFVLGTLSAPSMEDSVLMLRQLLVLTHTKHSPKILLVLVSNEECTNMEKRLEELWNGGYPYVIALEVPESFNGDRRPPLYVHRYTKLPPSYKRSIYDGDVSSWYVDQFQGILSPQFTLCLPNKNDTSYKDLSKVELNVLKEKLNVTFKEIIVRSGKNKCDLTYNLYYLLYNAFYSTSRAHTAPIYIDRFCLFLPAISQVSSTTSWGLTIAFVVGILIVVMISGFAALSNIETFRYPFNVVAVILGVWLNALRMSTLIEKVLYLCLVQVATRYTSMLYTELFSDGTMKQRQVRINDFEDLYGLNISIHMTKAMYNFMANNSIVPPDLMPMFQVVDNWAESGNSNKNIGYFSLQLMQMVVQKLKQHPKKRTNLCLGSVSVVHMTCVKWQYAERVNDLLWRINQYGFRKREYALNFRGDDKRIVEEQIGDSKQHKMLITLLYGYLLVVVVFVGELLVGWSGRWRRIHGGRRSSEEHRSRAGIEYRK